MNKDPRLVDLAKIHLAKKALGMDDSVYRAMLHAIVGVDSAKTLDDNDRGKVLWHLRCLGWRPQRARRGQERLIRKLWYELYALGAVHYPEDQALNTFVKRMTGMSGFHRLTVKQGQTMIESLKAWRRRVDPDPGDRGPGAARRPRRIEAQPAANPHRDKHLAIRAHQALRAGWLPDDVEPAWETANPATANRQSSRETALPLR